PTYRVSFAIGDEHAAKGVVDALTEVFFEGEAAIAAFERPDGRWDVTVHFAEPPDQPLVRELVANAAGADVAEGIAFDTVEAKALHEKVLASDIDPPSVQVARENARLNVAGHLVQAIRATGFAAPQFADAAPFDLVLANILANPLRQLATPMARHLAPSALVILSGLLTHQAPGVIAAYRARGLVPV